VDGIYKIGENGEVIVPSNSSLLMETSNLKMEVESSSSSSAIASAVLKQRYEIENTPKLFFGKIFFIARKLRNIEYTNIIKI